LVPARKEVRALQPVTVRKVPAALLAVELSSQANELGKYSVFLVNSDLQNRTFKLTYLAWITAQWAEQHFFSGITEENHLRQIRQRLAP
jgi:hypothetical protein